MAVVINPQSQGAVEAFNKTIIQKLQYEKLEKKDKFNIASAIEVSFQIYNNIVHSIIRVEPSKAFIFKKTKQINKVIENTIKSQISYNNSSIAIKKGSKALLSTNFIIKRKVLKETLKKKYVIQFQL